MKALPLRGTWGLERGLPTFNGSTPTGFFSDRRSSGKHRAIDFACPEGTGVLARGDVQVIRLGYASGSYGRYLTTRDLDNGHLYLDAHLKGWAVRQGARVKAGGLLAWSGNSGNSSGPHWHGEEWANPHDRNTAIDFLPDLVRLLEDDMPLSDEDIQRIAEKLRPLWLSDMNKTADLLITGAKRDIHPATAVYVAEAAKGANLKSIREGQGT